MTDRLFKDFCTEETIEGVVTNYIVIYEIVTPDFARRLKVMASSQMTPWLADGMVKLGIEQLEELGILEENE